MNNILKTLAACAAGLAICLPVSAKQSESEQVRGLIDKVNKHWQAENSPQVRAFWDNAAYHTGNMEAYFLTGNEDYLAYSEAWAEHNQWMGAKSNDRSKWKYSYGETDEYVLFGDWQICFQVYADLYNILPDDNRIRRAKEVMEYEMSTPNNDYWWWSDGLYMVMPVMTKYYKITGNQKYLDKLYEYILYSDSIMFDKEENLYYRDAKYVYPKHKSVNGKKDFWARGDGWVLAGLAKVLKDLPADYKHHDFFVQKFQALAKAVAALQQPEGYWTRSMMDPEHAPGPETSGTAFFTYGMLWGINNGYLSEAEYMPVVEKAWKYLSETDVEKVILVKACTSCDFEDLPDYVQKSLKERYSSESAHGSAVISWEDFLMMGDSYTGIVEAPVDIHRPLFRAYTSGSTGPSKQVTHSAHTMLSVVAQMNFYAGGDGFRPNLLITSLPPCLVAVVVSMYLMALSSNKLLILAPFCRVEDVDLEMMRTRPTFWPIIPIFMETVMRNGRIPDDYDMSHLQAAGVGSESYNNTQMKNAQEFLRAHNCNIRLTTGYGSSEAGSNVSMPMTPHPMGYGNVGVPTYFNTISIFEPGTQNELTYNVLGEVCISGPGLMLGYDNPEATAKTLQVHEDGMTWLHTGDIGFMNEDGVLYVQTRGTAPRYGGGDLATLPMENVIADAEIEGIDDEFFVVVPDSTHPGYYVPYLYIVPKEGYTVADLEDEIRECLEAYMQPVEIIEIAARPFFHFKTNRIGLARELLQDRNFKFGSIIKANREARA